MFIAFAFTGCSVDWNNYQTQDLESALISIQNENANLNTVVSAVDKQQEQVEMLSQITQTTMKSNLLVEYCYYQRVGLLIINETYMYSNGFVYSEDEEYYYAALLKTNYTSESLDYLAITVFDCYDRSYDATVEGVYSDFLILRFFKTTAYPLVAAPHAVLSSPVGTNLAIIGSYNSQMNLVEFASITTISIEQGQMTLLSSTSMLGFIVDSNLNVVGICLSSAKSGQNYLITASIDFSTEILIS